MDKQYDGTLESFKDHFCKSHYHPNQHNYE